MRRRLASGFRAFGRWLVDPRTGIAVAVSFLAAAVIAFVITSGQTAHDALAARDKTAAAATRRIDKLNGQIAELVIEVAAGREDVGKARADISALQEQVRQLGGRPVVVTTSTSATGDEGRTPATRPRPSPAPSTTTTTTVPPQRRCLAGIVCLGP